MSKTRLGLSLLLVVLLTGAIFYPGALTKPYSGDSQYYGIAHESSEAYNESLDDTFRNTGHNITASDLSEEQRKAFEEAKEQTPSSSGWQSIGPLVCDSALLLCDKYKTFPNPVREGDTDRMTAVVEDSTGESYRVKIGYVGGGANWDVDGIAEFITKLLILGPFAFFLSYRAWTVSPPQPTLTSLGYGSMLVVTVLGYPYLLMFTDVALPSWHLEILAVMTWAVILVEVGRGRLETQSERQSASD